MKLSFKDILTSLDEIKHSNFTQIPQETFHDLQDSWKSEINLIVEGIRR